uniref:Sensory neuron membrane protein 4 n=1 Tax=Aulacocentrum confusum TaxID=2767324 RepID=A0A7G8Z9J5_9HYME|nr:sensory neuron membrane protein 4 [Aulacocentrum confusum]
MEGMSPILVERGPYVYDIRLKKQVLSVNETSDEITLNVMRSYHFNRELSGRSDEEELVIINNAYLGTINTMVSRFPMFVGILGNGIINLFPNAKDIFLRGKAKDLLWDGMPLICDKEKHKELGIICTFLKKNRPSTVQAGDELNYYRFSAFGRINATYQGPITVNRGVQNKDALGNITAFKGLRVSKYWTEDGCNLVSGTDAITWPPMTERLPYVTVFEPNLCRRVTLNYVRDEVFHGLRGYRYELDSKMWLPENMGCYCPVTKQGQKCLEYGLLDISLCQEAPLIFSEPHFLHAEDSLLDYTRGLEPKIEHHSTYIIIEPTSGAPLIGTKKIQINLKINPVPAIALLSNLSSGYFPVLWAEEANNVSVTLLRPVIMAHRLINVMESSSWLVIIIGLFFIIKIVWIQGASDRQANREASKVTTDRSISHLNQGPIQKPEKRRRRAFE